MDRKQILDRLTQAGFAEKTRGWVDRDGVASQGMRHPSETTQGSLYVATNFLIATGPYRAIEHLAKPSRLNSKGVPIWENAELAVALTRIEEKYAKQSEGNRPAIERLCHLWDEVTDDFLAGRPTNVRPPFDSYFQSYGRRDEVQLQGFCEPFLGPLDRTPKMVFLSLNPGAVQPSWQHLDWEGRGGAFVNEIRRAGSYTRWAAEWSYLRPEWQSHVATLRGANHHWSRFAFMKAWYNDSTLSPQDRVDFELYPWHSPTFSGPALKLDHALLRQFVLDPLHELEAPLVFAFSQWWWQNLPKLGLEIVARLGDGGDRPINMGYKEGAKQGIVIARTPWGGLMVAEKHVGPPPGPPALNKVPLFRNAILEATT